MYKSLCYRQITASRKPFHASGYYLPGAYLARRVCFFCRINIPLRQQPNSPMRKLLSLLVILLLPAVLAAAPAKDSTAKIIGKVQHIVEDRPELPPDNIYNCEVCLYYQKDGKIDSLLTTTDWKGVFYIRNIKPQRIGLRLRYTGYETINGVYDIVAGDNVFYFSLKKAVKTLEAASVVAEVPLIRRIQDTTVYTTQSIKAGYDESLRQVLEQLPGFSVFDDRLSVDGKEVKRTYVNGLLVFGDRVTSAIDALKADEVTQVKVYDQFSAQARHRGNSNAEKERVLDIITKDLILTMDLASAGLSGGADFTGQGRYSTVASMAHHSEQLETHLTAAANNIGQAPESYTMERQPIRMLNQIGPMDSYKEVANARVSVDKYWKNRDFGNKASFSYSFSNVYSKNASTALTEYLEGANSPARTAVDTFSCRAVHRRHEGRIDINLDDTPFKSFYVVLRGSVDKQENDDFFGNYTLAPMGQERRVHQTSGARGKNYSAGTDISWINNDDTDWRPTFGFGLDISNNTNLSWTVDTLNTSCSKRNLHSDGYGRGINGNIGGALYARLANTKDHTAELLLSLRTIYTYSKQKQLSTDEIFVGEPVINIANSFDYTRHQLNSSATLGVFGTKNSLGSYNVNVMLNHRVLLTDEKIPVFFTNNKGFLSVGSNMKLIGRTFQLSAETDAITPAIEQISNRVSDANPIVLTAGNPKLKPGYIVKITGLYRPQTKKYKSDNTGNVNISAALTITFNPIVNSIHYFSEETVLDQWDGYVAQQGAMLYTYDNSSIPQWFVSLKPEYAASVAHNKLRINVTMDGSITSGPQNFGGEIVPILDKCTAANIKITYNPSKNINLTNSFSPSYLYSSREGDLVSERIRLGENFSLTWYITRKLRFGTQYRFTAYKYLSGIGSDHCSHYLNSGLELVLLKDRSLIIGIQGSDLLNSFSLYKTSVTSEKVRQTWTPTYGPNLLLKLVYQFRKPSN